MGRNESNQRLESVRILVQKMIMTLDSAFRRQEACIHLYGVSIFASILAMKRGQDHEIAAISGLLHDFYFYKTGILEFPGLNSAEAVRPLLRDMKIFTKEELITILQAIFHHGNRNSIHGPYEEILKDAYELQLYFQKNRCRLTQQTDVRLQNVLYELAIPGDISGEEVQSCGEKKIAQYANKRNQLADIAETLAGQNIIGVPGDERYREICSYWPDDDIYKGLHSSWCAAFVFHCCKQAGFLLPIRYPSGIYRFAGVGAWLEWAQLPENGFFYTDELDYTPQRGDIVIYEKLLSEDSHDHIGVVLACNDKELLVAEGNKDNQNFSSVFYRDRFRCILGYIRIANDYLYHFNGDYSPII